jgi:uncharacterized Fe-S radical SAM superfamily protein PflX
MTSEKIAEELKRIQDKIPKLWKDNVFDEVDKTPTIAFVIDKIIEDKVGTEEDRERLRVLRDTGEFKKKKVVENYKYAKLIDDFVSREIKKSVKAGRLPKDASKFKYEGINN